MFCVVWGYSNLKEKAKQYKQKTLSARLQTEIKILVNPGLAICGFERPGPDVSRVQKT